MQGKFLRRCAIEECDEAIKVINGGLIETTVVIGPNSFFENAEYDCASRSENRGGTGMGCEGDLVGNTDGSRGIGCAVKVDVRGVNSV